MSSIIAVRGSHGAPGRTTVAAHLAQALALDGPTLLIDADTVAPAVGTFFGITPDAPGLGEACALAVTGALTGAELDRLVVEIEPGFDVLIGAHPDAADPEPQQIAAVHAMARQRYSWIVVDTAAVSPRPAGESVAVDAALNGADHVIALVAADGLGLQRFVLALPALREVPGAVHVVTTKVRTRARGIATRAQVHRVLEEVIGVQPDAELPWSALALERAWLRAQHPSAAMDRDYATALDDVVALVRGPDAPPLRRAGRHRGRRIWVGRLAS